MSTKCALDVSVSVLGSRGSSRSTIVSLKFGPVAIGSAKLFGVWTKDQVLHDIRAKGVGTRSYKLMDGGEAVLRSQGIRVY